MKTRVSSLAVAPIALAALPTRASRSRSESIAPKSLRSLGWSFSPSPAPAGYRNWWCARPRWRSSPGWRAGRAFLASMLTPSS